MQLTILGGGGFRVPLIYRALTEARGMATPTCVVLYDVDRHRLDVIEQVCAQIGATIASPPVVHSTTDLNEALRGADVVFNAIRVGGTAGRVVDERVAIAAGLLGQETVGAGGLAYALRTLPVTDVIAARIAALAPHAWTINFTNPAGIITAAMRTHLGRRVFGICDTPLALVRRVARLLQVPAEQAVPDYQGINHLGFLTGFYHDGQDLLPGLLADPERLGHLEEARIFGTEAIQLSGAIPNEYLHYYTAAPEEPHTTRGEFLAAQQAGFYQAGPTDDAYRRWQAVLDERESTYMAEAREEERRSADVADGGYHQVAVDLMTALRTGRPARMILGVGNEATIPALAPEAVVEVLCTVDDDGAHPIAPRTVLRHEPAALMSAVADAEATLVEAVRTRSRSLAVRAFASHPLVDGRTSADRLVEAYITAHPQIAEVLTGL